MKRDFKKEFKIQKALGVLRWYMVAGKNAQGETIPLSSSSYLGCVCVAALDGDHAIQKVCAEHGATNDGRLKVKLLGYYVEV